MSIYFILKENWDFNLPFISFGFRSCFITVLKIANWMAFVGSSRVSQKNDRKRWKRILGWNWESVFICSAKWFQSAEYGTFLTTGYFSDLKHKYEIKVFFFLAEYRVLKILSRFPFFSGLKFGTPFLHGPP